MQCIQIIKLLCVDNQTVIGLHILRVYPFSAEAYRTALQCVFHMKVQTPEAIRVNI